jgi:hypothetical protein
MIVAGIDEAGYGPLLGPLVVGCSAFRVDGALDDEAPCLWTKLSRVVSKKRVAGGRKLHINDSKVVYSPSQGIKELERSVLALAATVFGPASDLNAMVRQTAPHAIGDLEKYPWYRAGTGEAFPISHDAVSIGIQANALGVEMRRQETACVHLAARLVCERQFNTMVNATRNKASALFSTSAIHLDHLLRAFPEEEVLIFCDSQGARRRYGSLLRTMFEEWALEVIVETDTLSEYRLGRGGRWNRLIFCDKAEARCMAVAVASMLCKYLREALMGRFNAFWASHLPQVTPTAGYYTDGLRFLRDIEPKRKELGIPDSELIRCR